VRREAIDEKFSFTVVVTLENGSTIEINSVVVPPKNDKTLSTVRGLNKLVAFQTPQIIVLQSLSVQRQRKNTFMNYRISLI
jgi:hypothetical protein